MQRKRMAHTSPPILSVVPTATLSSRTAPPQLARLEFAIDEAPRPDHVVIVSDHGQTQDATFLQRYEELLGFHGGMASNQTHPFLLVPAGFEIPDEHMVGAATIPARHF
jgi:hypothetical protein